MKLYYECFEGTSIPYDDYVADALIGAYSLGYECIPFSDVDKISFDKETIVVGCVENTQKYFKKHLSIEIEPIEYHSILSDYMGRKTELVNIKDIKPPCFIKPNKIKAFTGFVVTNNPLYDNEISQSIYGYEGLVYMEEIINIVSEYRCYVKNGLLIGVKHYSGDDFISLNRTTVLHCVIEASRLLNQLTFTLDFGITKEGKTILIEANDAWSIGNYGLTPIKYFHFIKERWFQILRQKK